MLEVLFQKLSVPLLALDEAGRVEACNRAFERLFRFQESELAGKDPDEILVPPKRRGEVRQWRRRAALGQEIRRAVQLRAGDGRLVDVELHLIPRRRDSEVHGFFALYHDLTRLRELEEKLRQAEKMEAIGHLTGGIAHDFNNLLTAILGYAEMLELALHDKPAFKKNAHEIRKAAERAGQLTNRLLAFSRKQDVSPSFLHLNSVILEIEGMLRRVLGEKVRIETRLDVELGLVWIDRVQLEQVILNLVVNARDAMPEGGELTLETRSFELDDREAEAYPACVPGRYMALRVRDTGCGMDEPTRRRIFEPYFTTKGSGRGTGLGLASVYGIVTQNGGFVRVESEPGKGTLFEVALPRAQSAQVELAIDASGKIEYGRETILVVEDDPLVREVTRDYLRMSGYRVLEASSEAEALEQIRDYHEPIHLLVTDVVMPDTSGPELARKLTRLRPEMKVLYQSGYADNEVLRQGGPEPGWGYLQKPVRQKLMTQKVREILDGAVQARRGVPSR
jgi:PAS domain S-box-containing protein